ncbi:hypothetical protein BAE44_0022471 [Dichanthelium oligosanthes]|uniref:FBD domain-containing protein n=1 Tax=Dichanthelium oligosanthes TaxID=888268 RepID=A0A1E5UUG3_9POAL|nr:hypothetical protein BAE44_0022471 [Dichanthelium oligosanthes]
MSCVFSWLQLPTSSHDTSVGNSSEVVEEDDEPDEVSEVDQSDEVLSKKDEPDEGLSEEDETDGDLSEEDETEEEVLKEELVQEYMLEERPYYEDVYEEDSLDEMCHRKNNSRKMCQTTWLTKLEILPSLGELQLVMLEMDSTNLAYTYAFFRCCWCPQLERLFVQLPSSTSDTFVYNSLEVAEEDEQDEVLFEVDEPDEELYEEDDPDEEEEEPDEELCEAYQAEEELLLEELSEEYMLKERLYFEDVYEEDCSKENVPEDEQSEEDVPEDEKSEEDVPEDEQSEEDEPLYDLNNLIFARLMKFKGQFFEMRLVSFLLRRATGLQKLLLVPPVGVGNYMEALAEEPLDTSHFLETILNFEKASPDVQIVLSDSDPDAILPVHFDVF